MARRLLRAAKSCYTRLEPLLEIDVVAHAGNGDVEQVTLTPSRVGHRHAMPGRARRRGGPGADTSSFIARMDDVISRCEAQFVPRGPIADHPVLGPLTAAEWRGFHITHGKHHARQILRLRSSRKIIE